MKPYLIPFFATVGRPQLLNKKTRLPASSNMDVTNGNGPSSKNFPTGIEAPNWTPDW